MSAQPSPQADGRKSPRIHEAGTADARLRELGLTTALLAECLTNGDHAARQANEFHPVTASGMFRWLATAETLRRLLADEGWQPTDIRNSPRIVNPAGTIILTVAGGNDAVGHPDRSLQFARQRGETTARAVAINLYLQDQLPFPPTADMSAEPEPTGVTWFLMYHRDTSDNVLFGELARPVRMNATGLAVEWAERIILPPIDFGSVRLVTPVTDEQAGIDFHVEAI